MFYVPYVRAIACVRVRMHMHACTRHEHFSHTSITNAIFSRKSLILFGKGWYFSGMALKNPHTKSVMSLKFHGILARFLTLAYIGLTWGGFGGYCGGFGAVSSCGRCGRSRYPFHLAWIGVPVCFGRGARCAGRAMPGAVMPGAGFVSCPSGDLQAARLH